MTQRCQHFRQIQGSRAKLRAPLSADQKLLSLNHPRKLPQTNQLLASPSRPHHINLLTTRPPLLNSDHFIVCRNPCFDRTSASRKIPAKLRPVPSSPYLVSTMADTTTTPQNTSPAQQQYPDLNPYSSSNGASSTTSATSPSTTEQTKQQANNILSSKVRTSARHLPNTHTPTVTSQVMELDCLPESYPLRVYASRAEVASCSRAVSTLLLFPRKQ